jgi:hypothetical protein
MARFFLHSHDGVILFLARRLQAEGHEVTLHVEGNDTVGRGLVPRGTLPSRGSIVLGTAAFDESLGPRLLGLSGIATPETRMLPSLAAVQAFLATHSGVWHVEPPGWSGPVPVLLQRLRWASPNAARFVVQRRVAGAAVSCDGWFDGTKWVPPFCCTVTDVHAWTGDTGPRVPSAASVVRVLSGERPALAIATVRRLTPWLRASRFAGPVRLDCLVADGTVKVLRFGRPSWHGLALLWKGPLGESLVALDRGELGEIPLRRELAMTLCVTTPPWPNGPAPGQRGLPLDPKLLLDPRHIMIADVMAERGDPVLAGASGLVCYVGETARTLDEARDGVLRRAEHLDIPDKQYRLDPGAQVHAAWSALAAAGLAPQLGPREVVSDLGSTAASREGTDGAIAPPPPAPFVVDVPPGGP